MKHYKLMYTTKYRTTFDGIRDQLRKDSTNLTVHFWRGSNCVARIACYEPEDLTVIDGTESVTVSENHYSTGTRQLHIHLQMNQ